MSLKVFLIVLIVMYHICSLTEELNGCSLLTVVHVNRTHEFFLYLSTQNSFAEQSGDINST